MTSVRNPYPFPRFENDEKFRGPQASLKEPYAAPTHLAQKEDPWQTLHNKYTLSSSRHEVFHNDPQAPRDSLDFNLKAQYNQHKEFLKAQNETKIQMETLGMDHGRILKNKIIKVKPDKNDLNHPLRVAKVLKMEHVCSIDTAIEGHHTQTTNKGYSRKPDGGFFTS